MIANTTIFDAMSRAIQDKSNKRIYSDELQLIADEAGQYLVYFNKYKEERPQGKRLPDVQLGRLVVTADGQYWLGLRHSWVRDDDNGKTVQEAYERVYQDISERWADIKKKV